MAHPFYGDYKKPDRNVNKTIDDMIKLATQIVSNERIVDKQQNGAKERLEMELDSVEKRHNRTESRLDKQLQDQIKTNIQSRRHKEDYHPLNIEFKKQTNRQLDLTNDYNEAVQESLIKYENEKNEAGFLEEKANIGISLANKFVNSENAVLDAFAEEGMFEVDAETGMLKVDEAGFPIPRQDLAGMFESLSDDELMTNFQTFKKENPNYDDISFAKFKEIHVAKEEARNSQINQQLQKNMDSIISQNENFTSPEAVISEMTKKYGDQDWFKNFEVYAAQNPNWQYSKQFDDIDLTGYKFKKSDELGMELDQMMIDAGNAHNLSSVVGDESFHYDVGSIFETFGKDRKATKQIIEDFTAGLNSTSSEFGGKLFFADEDMWLKAKKDDDGNPFLHFEEDDAGGDNDHWIGRLENGQIVWQKPTWDSTINNLKPSGKKYSTKDMMDKTEAW